jgi:hypothetical protein
VKFVWMRSHCIVAVLAAQLPLPLPLPATMNTIAPPPQLKKLPPSKRFLGIALGLAGAGATNLVLGYAGFSLYARGTTFVPYDAAHDDLATPVFKKHNPSGNPPVCIDHAVKTIPLAKLKETDQSKLTTGFCRGVWSGLGYAYQRRYLEKKYRALENRKDHLWDRRELGESDYAIGTKITDHFEVVEHTPEKVRSHAFGCKIRLTWAIRLSCGAATPR